MNQPSHLPSGLFVACKHGFVKCNRDLTERYSDFTKWIRGDENRHVESLPSSKIRLDWIEFGKGWDSNRDSGIFSNRDS